MPENEPAPSAGTAAQPGPKASPAMSALIDSEGLGAADDDIGALEAAPVSASDEPQADRDRGRARARAAIVEAAGAHGRYSLTCVGLLSYTRGSPRHPTLDWSVPELFSRMPSARLPASAPHRCPPAATRLLRNTHPGGLRGPFEWVFAIGRGSGAYSTMTTMLCQPVAPLGKGVASASGCTSPLRSVARTVSWWRPGRASQGRYHWRQ